MIRLLRTDTGTATIVSAGVIAALAAVLLAVATAYAQVRDQHQAQLAADLAAVAGAWAHAFGEDACGRARQVAELNQATVSHCHVDGADVTVRVNVGKQERRAKAGPI